MRHWMVLCDDMIARFAMRVAKIRNDAHVNEEVDPRLVIKQLKIQIKVTIRQATKPSVLTLCMSIGITGRAIGFQRESEYSTFK
jgi:hypothetical protein